jgi:ATP-dependent RNA helicase DDX21
VFSAAAFLATSTPGVTLFGSLQTATAPRADHGARPQQIVALRLRGGKKEKRSEKTKDKHRSGGSNRRDEAGVADGKVEKRGRSEKSCLEEPREGSPRMITRSMSPKRSISPEQHSSIQSKGAKERKVEGGKTRVRAKERGDSKMAGTVNKTLVSDFRISQGTARALAQQGITSLFPIQIATFDHIFDGADLMARARTGTGKTLAFVLPVNERLLAAQGGGGGGGGSGGERGRAPQAVVMVPTRELCVQVH